MEFLDKWHWAMADYAFSLTYGKGLIEAMNYETRVVRCQFDEGRQWVSMDSVVTDYELRDQ